MSEVNRNPSIYFGRPRLEGRRLTVIDVVEGIYREGKDGYKIYSKEFEMRSEDINACLKYCASLECKKKIDGDRFCYRCVLDEEAGIDYNEIEEITPPDSKILVKIGQGGIFLGKLDEYWESEEKVKGWIIAQDVNFDNLDNFK